MAKRNKQNSDARSFDVEDNPIGLTGAFEVIRDPQAVQYDTGDTSIGLTEAFGAVSGEEDVVHSWDEAGKWTDFDWDAVPSEYDDYSEASRAEGETQEQTDEVASAPEDGSSEKQAQSGDSPEKQAQSDGSSETAAVSVNTGASNAGKPSGGKRGRGRHAAPEPELTPRMKKSKRTRKVLIVIVILLILLIGVVVYFGARVFKGSQEEAAQQAQEQVAAPKDNIAEGSGDDAVETAAKATDVPVLTSLLGKTTDEAVAEIGRGALITQNREVKEKGNKIKTTINVALTEEPADSKTGTPTVYLGLDKDGKIIQVGYSASASALGFGSLSFADAISNEHVVEKTLARIGVEIPEGSAVLPKKKDKYSTYASDGATVVKERCSFNGDTQVNGTDCEWSSVLSYDYTTQVVTGNLSDTVRIIYVYVTEK